MTESSETVHYLLSVDGDESWLVQSLELFEGLSEPYRLHLDLLNPTPGEDAGALFGKTCSLTASRPGGVALSTHGIVKRVEKGGTSGDGASHCRIDIGPAFSLLRQREDSRIFQDMSVPEIVEAVAADALAGFDRSIDIGGLASTYPPREYTVQYQESDFDFISRLLEQEGVGYRFDHSDDVELLVLFDANDQLPEVQTSDGGSVRYSPQNLEMTDQDVVFSFEAVSEMATTQVALRDFDWTNPQVAIEGVESDSEAASPAREVYAYQRDLTITGYSEPQYSDHDGSGNKAQLRLEALRVEATVAHGVGRVLGFTAGTVFELSEHGDPSLDGKYVVLEVEHLSGANDEELNLLYSNRFRCIPYEVPYRPPRLTPRPRVHGIQTATVTGPAGQEIHTDVHGRIKVQFHWDRVGENDDRSSCWIRVAQNWAGPGWGFVFLPRIGMEVLVTFVDGDADRPMVTGCVYNGDNPPPYALPDEMTKSTIKTQSSPGGEGFNELRFEDKAGQEEIYIHAQKDFNEEVLHNHSTHVMVDQSNTVDQHQDEIVRGNQTLTVETHRSKTVQGNETVAVQGTRTETVTKDETLTLNANRSATVMANESLTVMGSRSMMVQAAATETIIGAHTLSVMSAQNVTVAASKTDTILGSYAITVGSAFSIAVGGVSLGMMDGGMSVSAEAPIKSESGEEISLSSGSASITLKSDGTIEISGTTLNLTGSSEIALDGGGSTVDLGASGASMAGAKVDITADGAATVKGATINNN